ncbi:DUF1249 domain-containing protein [Gilvimarinus algae]|uniref:DUF1249 domain-containing protein n=1 Tax=Gilvimarinus algae TaxID=3058037 RepID=A0ABT8TA61_9GAMM|nr:DUF1249 domain-containing protein [Gilvimarinus sp. SDUM040014]MDO3380883.1 DUF1249 domain-containing protein [Gilvimarinus sp. SDUM040014]
MAQCEANYWLLRKLTPGVAAREHWQFAVERGESRWEMRIDVTERMRYTTTVRVRREDEGGSHWLQPPQLVVRLYHDAQLAEVLAWEGHRRLEARYDYPNGKMYQADEKSQFNRFLGEWLTHCLEHGHSLDDFSLLVK